MCWKPPIFGKETKKWEPPRSSQHLRCLNDLNDHKMAQQWEILPEIQNLSRKPRTTHSQKRGCFQIYSGVVFSHLFGPKLVKKNRKRFLIFQICLGSPKRPPNFENETEKREAIYDVRLGSCIFAFFCAQSGPVVEMLPNIPNLPPGLRTSHIPKRGVLLRNPQYLCHLNRFRYRFFLASFQPKICQRL